MIEILRDDKDNYVLLLNGSEYHSEIDKDGEGYAISIDGIERNLELLEHNLNSFPPTLSYLRIADLNFNWGYDFDVLWIGNESVGKNEPPFFDVRMYSSPKLELWKKTYSFDEYFTQLEKFLDEEFDGKISVTENDRISGLSEGFELTISEFDKDKPIIEEINSVFKLVKSIHEQIDRKLLEINNKDSISAIFNFPEKIKSSCEQYLLYFAQFLQDLGINATSNLVEEAGKVLFSVTPTDETQALDKIREALAVYLKLPESPIIFDDSFAAMRLQQQIDNLQHSQKMAVRELQLNEKLLIAQSDTIREKNVTISQQQSIIEQKDKIIEKISSKSVMVDSLENKEKLYEGLEFVPSEALKKYAGVIFQPMSFFKELGKNILGKDEFTSLDLDKDVEK